MARPIARSNKQVDDLLNKCSEQEDEGGSAFPGMTYEQGVKAGIEWIMNEDSEYPLE
jgi:hypothetical protein